MIENNYPSEEILKARSELVLDGWQDDPQLPDGWKTKVTLQNKEEGWKRRLFLSEQGFYFTYARGALKFLLSTGTYSQQHVDYLASLSMRSGSARGTQSIVQDNLIKPDHDVNNHGTNLFDFKGDVVEEANGFNQILDSITYKKVKSNGVIQQEIPCIEEKEELERLRRQQSSKLEDARRATKRGGEERYMCNDI